MAILQIVYDTPAQARAAPVALADREFRPDIEGLRALAVLLVIASHAGLGLFAGGYVGVDVFFVVSGFLITGLLLKAYDREGRVSLASFYARRVRRILPAATLVLLATVVVSFVALDASRATHIAQDAQWTSLFAANLRFIQQQTNYLTATLPPSPLQQYWTLGVEEQFYAVWPLTIIAILAVARRVPLRRKLGMALCLIIAASLWWSIAQTASNATAAYFSPLTRAWELGLGALLAVVTPFLLRLPRLLGVTMSVCGLVAILAAGLTFTSFTAFPGYAAVLPVDGTALVVAGGTIAPGGGAERILRFGLFQWLGKLSYSIYLWHWPLLTIPKEYQGKNLGAGETLLLCLAAVALAAVTFRVIEYPVRNSQWLKRHSPLLSVALGVCFVAGSLAGTTGFIAWLGPHAAPVQAPTTVVFP
jgi:peptidoglycan/LPS O-acetylase OafA/YrhL